MAEFRGVVNESGTGIQEVSQVSLFESCRTRVEKTGERSLFITNNEDDSITADPKREPCALDIFSLCDDDNLLNDTASWITYFLSLVFRILNSQDQTVS